MHQGELTKHETVCITTRPCDDYCSNDSPELPISGFDELGHRRPGCLCQLTEQRSQKYSREAFEQ